MNATKWLGKIVFAVLAIVYVAIAFVPDFVATEIPFPLEVVDTILTVVFATEFTVRIGASYDRRAYLRSHWIDLLALIPLARGLRVLRLLRLLRLVRAFAGLYRALARVPSWSQATSSRRWKQRMEATPADRPAHRPIG